MFYEPIIVEHKVNVFIIINYNKKLKNNID